MQAFDNRLVRFGVTIDDETIEYDQTYQILATGTKYTDGTLGECALRIDNISKDTRDMLIAKTSPWVIPRTYANITLDVGRESIGTFRLFEGQATAANPTQPPDIGLIFTSLTLSFLLGNIGTLNMGPISKLSSICQRVATMLGVSLEFKATDRNIGNYSFGGPLVKQVQKLNDMGGICAFVDNTKLVVLNSNQARSEEPITVSAATGMIGVPQITELGVCVKTLINNEIKVGDSVKIESIINPAANGTFIVYKLGFEVASRDVPFYWLLELRKPEFTLGFQ